MIFSARKPKWHQSIAAFCMACAMAFTSALGPALAQGRVAVVRDAEIEALLRDYTAPILKAAGLANSGIEVVIVNDPSFNAFVTGRRIFIFTGALMMTETPNEIIGVIAHEAGHIAGSHQFRLRERLDAARTMSIVASLLGIGAVVGGAASGDGQVAQAGAGIAAAGNEVARRGLLAYQRSEESAADKSAIQYLDKTGQSAAGMLITFERLADLMQFNSNVDPYQMSHPLPRERINALRESAIASPNFSKMDSDALQARHDLMRAKIAAYTGGQGALSRIFRDRDSAPARYGAAILATLAGSPADAIKKAQALTKSQPKNPYFHEVLGDAYLRANKTKEAAAAYSTANKLAGGRSNLLRMAQGRAYLAAGDAEAAVKALETAMEYDKRSADGWQALAQAYGMLKRTGEAELATAEMHFNRGAFKEAKKFATRAQQRMPSGSPDWLRAQDILNFKS
jgi:predicted Zn-dependent protease